MPMFCNIIFKNNKLKKLSHDETTIVNCETFTILERFIIKEKIKVCV